MSERDEAIKRWRDSEGRLYPVVTVRPELYQAAIGVVRSLADHLESVPDLDALVTSYLASNPAADFEAAGIGRSQVPPELEDDMLRDAAFQIRSRELTQRAAQESTARAIDLARKTEAPTAMLWTNGDDELTPPYRRVEMSLATGFAVSISTEYNPDTMQPLHVLEGFQLDPDTGAGAEPLSPRREFDDPELWRAATAELRRSLLTP